MGLGPPDAEGGVTKRDEESALRVEGNVADGADERVAKHHHAAVGSPRVEESESPVVVPCGQAASRVNTLERAGCWRCKLSLQQFKKTQFGVVG